jgi:leukotriene-A4 hydrolase
VFIERLQTLPTFTNEIVAHLGQLYKFASTNNAEIRYRYYILALSSGTYARESVRWAAGLEDGLVKGRMKFCRPVFRTVGKIEPELAKEIFGQTKENFHPIARRMIEKVCLRQPMNINLELNYHLQDLGLA